MKKDPAFHKLRMFWKVKMKMNIYTDVNKTLLSQHLLIGTRNWIVEEPSGSDA